MEISGEWLWPGKMGQNKCGARFIENLAPFLLLPLYFRAGLLRRIFLMEPLFVNGAVAAVCLDGGQAGIDFVAQFLVALAKHDAEIFFREMRSQRFNSG